MAEDQREHRPLLQPEEIEQTAVYPVIHMIRADITHFIDTPLTYEALSAPDLTYTLVRPLEEKYNKMQEQGNMSIVFCFLINRVRFLRDQNLTSASISRTRAALCEILAVRALRFQGDSTLRLTLAVTTSWPVYSGADPKVIEQAKAERDDDLEDRVGNAIEMAIISRAKGFIKSSACQKVITSIWSGKCVYQAESSHSILADTYKRTPIHFYDPHKAPLLDHYRLKVPAIRSVLEYVNFLLLFILFILALELNELERVNPAELIFIVYALGFTLEKVASMQEHGVRVYFTGTWNGFDLAFVTVYCAYAFLRLYGVAYDVRWARHAGVDCLAVIAVLMFPRLAFVTLRNNLMVLSLRAMIAQFAALMLIAAFCFGGFLYALWTLSRNGSQYSVGQIAWWMLDLWFGLDASGFQWAFKFHPFFGPVLMVTYACLSNTLLLTVLVSILSHTFSTISEDALAEAMFRRAVSTIEGVKADPLFSYLPPINLVALCVMLPASYILTPRWFHKVNVFMIRATNFPILLGIAWYERQAKNTGSVGFYETMTATVENAIDTLPRHIRRLPLFEGLAGSGNDIDAIFEIEEELGTAVSDTEEAEDIRPLPREANQPRRPSNSVPQRPSPSPLSPSSPAYSKKEAGAEPSPSISPIALPRHRTTSILSKGPELMHSFTSPLAQVFHPLVVDDEESEEAQGPTGLVSFGPASRRRRLSSRVQRRPPPETIQQGSSSDIRRPSGTSVQLSRNLSGGSGSVQMSRKLSGGSGSLPESPMPGDVHMPETAAEMEDQEGDHGGSGGMPQWISRLERIEKQQRRIEALLLKLTQGGDTQA